MKTDICNRLSDFDAEIARVKAGIPDKKSHKKSQAMNELASRAAAAAKGRKIEDPNSWAEKLANSHSPDE